MKKHKFKNYSLSDKVFYIIITIILSVFFLMVLYPCVFVVSASFSSGTALNSGKVVLWPVDFSLEGYRTVFNTSSVWSGFCNSIIVTVAGTFINIAMTMTAAYCLSRRDLPGRNGIMLLFSFTMFFGGGMIPNYILVQKLGFLNTYWSLIIPGAIGVYNMIVARTFIANSIPEEMLDAARIDGCSDFAYYIKMVLPLSKAIISVLILYYAVGHWNSYFNAMLYLRKPELYTLSIVLRNILLSSYIDPSTVSDPELAMYIANFAGQIKYSLIVVCLVPVMLLYPFAQKYFVKGVMIGSIKG